MDKVTVRTVAAAKGKRRLVMVTAYDAPSARLADRAGIDMVLVGDSLGMVVLGYASTLPVTLEEVLHHQRAVARGCSRPLLVVDLPFGSYQGSREEAFAAAAACLKQGAEAVKLEGGEEMAPTVEFLVRRGVPVMGHVGLTPQSVHRMGGYRVQGRTEEQRHRLLHGAGAFAVVLEGIPASLAEEITGSLSIPTVGIGAGAGCDGQVLVMHDLLGLFEEFRPKFVKRFAELAGPVRDAVSAYGAEVRAGTFPGKEHSF
jgi:3-methyl-2-oxobutanoate hydroxymethyltransferase